MKTVPEAAPQPPRPLPPRYAEYWVMHYEIWVNDDLYDWLFEFGAAVEEFQAQGDSEIIAFADNGYEEWFLSPWLGDRWGEWEDIHTPPETKKRE